MAKSFHLIIIHFQSICLWSTEAMVFLRRIAIKARIIIMDKRVFWIKSYESIAYLVDMIPMIARCNHQRYILHFWPAPE